MGGLFGGQESEEPRRLEAFPGATDILQRIGQAAETPGLEAIGRAGQPFPSPLIAPLSQFQEAGIGNIGGVLGRPSLTESPLFQQGQQAISGALEGFDPFRDLRFQALRTNLERELKRAKDRIAARTSASDEFFGGGRLSQERELEESAFGDISTLAGVLEAESRRNQLAAVPQALGFARTAEQDPLNRLRESLFGIGAAPRGFQQEQISAQQQDIQRQLQELANLGLGTSLQTSMFRPDFYVPSFGPSPFAELAGGIGEMGGLEEVLGSIGNLGGLFGGFGTSLSDLFTGRVGGVPGTGTDFTGYTFT